MPTTLDRHTITETPPIAAMLDDAATIWPDLSRPDLLRRLMEAGHDYVTDKRADDRRRRLAALNRVSGSMPGVWPPGGTRELKEEWPA